MWVETSKHHLNFFMELGREHGGRGDNMPPLLKFATPPNETLHDRYTVHVPHQMPSTEDCDLCVGCYQACFCYVSFLIIIY